MVFVVKEGMKLLGFVSVGVQLQIDGIVGFERNKNDVNDEEIGLEDDEEEEEGVGVDVVEKFVFDSVFGNLVKVRNVEDDSNGRGDKREFVEVEVLGVKERFKR